MTLVGADGFVGGIYFEFSAGLITNSIVWGNEATGGASGHEIVLLGTTLDVSYSDVRNRPGFNDVCAEPSSTVNWGDGSINADPLFVGSGDYHLTAGSPCIDAGTNPGFFTDIDGDVRPQGNGYDIGSDEFPEGLPTTVTVYLLSIPAGDGTVRESNENSNAGGAFNSTFDGPHALRLGDDYGIRARGEMQYKAIVSFDTSTIPDAATIQSVTLMLATSGSGGTNPFTTHGACYVDISTDSFSGDPALQKTDFQATATATQVATVTAPPLPNDCISQGSLNGAGLTAINKTRLTQMRVYFSTDDNDNNADDWIGFYSGESATPEYRPMLVVTYQP